MTTLRIAQQGFLGETTDLRIFLVASSWAKLQWFFRGHRCHGANPPSEVHNSPWESTNDHVPTGCSSYHLATQWFLLFSDFSDTEGIEINSCGAGPGTNLGHLLHAHVLYLAIGVQSELLLLAMNYEPWLFFGWDPILPWEGCLRGSRTWVQMQLDTPEFSRKRVVSNKFVSQLIIIST